MKTEEQVRAKIRHLELAKENSSNAKLHDDWIDAMRWVLEEYCDGLDCAWCSNTECINM